MVIFSQTLANSALSNKLQMTGIVAFILKYKISRKVVIKEIPEDYPLEKLKEAIEMENSRLVVDSLFRLKCHNRITKEIKDSQLVCTELRGEDIFEHMVRVRLCFQCGRIGHIDKFYDTHNLSELHRWPSIFDAKDAKCLILSKLYINCRGEYSTLNRGCPTYKKHMKITKIMINDNLPFLKARR